MPATLTDDGLQIQTLDEIVAELQAALRDPVVGFGPDFVLDEHEVIPMLTAILAEREASVQALAKAVLDAGVPGSARGVHEDNIAAITGTIRNDAIASTVAAEMHGVALATIPIGRIARHNPTQTLWTSLSAVDLDGSGDGTVVLQANDVGPIEIVASADWTVITGDANLTSIESTADSIVGSLDESDDALEARRVAELATLGTGTEGAIVANLQQDFGIPVKRIFVNRTHVTDADGLRGQAIEILVGDGGTLDDEYIARSIQKVVTAGADTQGNVAVDFVDERGSDRHFEFSRSVQIPVWLRITLDTTSAEVPLGDETAVATAIQEAADAQGDALAAGLDVLPIAWIGTALAQTPTNSVTAITVERSLDGSSWSTSPLVIAAREEAVFNTARIVVLVLP